jgi:hypothetical protein
VESVAYVKKKWFPSGKLDGTFECPPTQPNVFILFYGISEPLVMQHMA